MNNADLARALGLNRSTITGWLKEWVIPSRGQRGALAEALGLDPGVFEEIALRAERLKMSEGRESGDQPVIHPALAQAIGRLDWRAQATLAKTINALTETKPPTFRRGKTLDSNRTPELLSRSQGGNTEGAGGDGTGRMRPEGTRQRRRRKD